MGYQVAFEQAWEQIYPDAVQFGKRLYKENALQDMISSRFEDVYDFITGV
jgi:hypothetical protein